MEVERAQFAHETGPRTGRAALAQWQASTDAKGSEASNVFGAVTHRALWPGAITLVEFAERCEMGQVRTARADVLHAEKLIEACEIAIARIRKEVTKYAARVETEVVAQ